MDSDDLFYGGICLLALFAVCFIVYLGGSCVYDMFYPEVTPQPQAEVPQENITNQTVAVQQVNTDYNLDYWHNRVQERKANV